MKKYSWRKADNNTYQIFKIPIFQVCPERKVSLDNILEALNKFQLDKKKEYLPRAFLGHHVAESTDKEREGAGFLDNMSVDIDGCVWVDIVDIPEKAWLEIYKRNYVYVSVEWIPSEIVGLAFLSSSAPFFKFPPVLLEKDENMAIPIVKFARKFAESEEKKPVVTTNAAEPQPVEPVKNAAESEPTDIKPHEPDTDSKDIGSALQAIKLGIEAILKHLTAHTEWEGQPTPTASSVANEAPKEGVVADVKQAKAAYQSNQQYQKLERDLAIMKFERDLEKKNLPKAMIDSAVSAAQKSKDLESLNAAISFMSFAFDSGHPAGQVIQKFSVSEAVKKQIPEDQKQIAVRAEQAYNDTISCGDKRTVETFSKVFPTIDTFVSHVLEQSKIDHQYLSKMTLKE